jgi:hypothetical protein
MEKLSKKLPADAVRSLLAAIRGELAQIETGMLAGFQEDLDNGKACWGSVSFLARVLRELQELQ